MKKVTINANQLKAMKNAFKAVNWKQNKRIPVLQHFMLFAENGSLKLRTTNGVNYITLTLDESQENFFILLPIETFDKIKLGKKDLATLTINEKITLSVNGMDMQVKTMDVSLYPEWGISEDSKAIIELDQNYINSVTDAVKFTSNSEARPILQTICHRNGSLIATDSHRLYTKENVYNSDVEFLLHKQAAEHMGKLFENEKGITLYIKDNSLTFESLNVKLEIKNTIHSSYPDVSRIIPQNFKNEVVIDRSRLFAVLNQAQKQIKDKNLQVYIKQNEDKLQLECANKESTTNIKAELETNKIDTCEQISIYFNVSYLLDAISQIDSNYVTLKYTGNLSPAVFTGENEMDLHLILPIRKAA